MLFSMKYNAILIGMTAFLLGASCGTGAQQEPVATEADTVDEMLAEPVTSDEPESLIVLQDEENVAATTADSPAESPAATAPEPKRKAAASATGGAKETIYISTYGANGKVWGYVTMTGNTGRGTIHDDNENTLSIRVTRHGGELFGIDQNGREYVFRM